MNSKRRIKSIFKPLQTFSDFILFVHHHHFWMGRKENTPSAYLYIFHPPLYTAFLRRIIPHPAWKNQMAEQSKSTCSLSSDPIRMYCRGSKQFVQEFFEWKLRMPTSMIADPSRIKIQFIGTENEPAVLKRAFLVPEFPMEAYPDPLFTSGLEGPTEVDCVLNLRFVVLQRCNHTDCWFFFIYGI